MKIKGYNIGQIFYLALSLVVTKIIYPKARLLRLPFFFRVQGRLEIGKGATIGRSCRIDVHSGGELFFGDKIQINDNCQIACAGKLLIGNNVLIASKVFISDHDHNYEDEGAPAQWALCVDNVKIGDNCWIGNGVSILKGVVIGHNSVIGAGSVVTKSFPESSIIAGVPAKLISSRVLI